MRSIRYRRCVGFIVGHSVQTGGLRCFSRVSLLVALTVTNLVAIGSPAFAGEEPEHYHLVYALARTVGFSDRDARLVATASWSVDLNDDTTAFNAKRGGSLATGDIAKVVKFLPASPGVVLHSSTSVEAEL